MATIDCTMLQRRLHTSELPASAPAGQLVIDVDTGKLYRGTGTGLAVCGADTSGLEAALTAETAARAAGDVATLATAEAYTDALAASTVAALVLRELTANKDTDVALAANSDTKYPSQKAVKAYIDGIAALKANLASPALTGNPTAPTQAALNNSTRIATTAYSNSAVAVETARAQAAEALAELLSHKDAASGYAGLDSSGLIVVSEMPVINSSQLGGFHGDGRINGFGGENSGQPASGALVAVANTIAMKQFQLVGHFKIGRVSFMTAVAAGITALVLSSVANASAGSTVYTGTITGGASNAFAGYTFVVAGFTNGANNGTFLCTASSTTTLTLSNASGTSESHAGTATPQAKFALAIYDSTQNNLLLQTGELDNSALGNITATFTRADLPPGVYYLAIWANNLLNTQRIFTANNLRQIWGGSVNGSGITRTGAAVNSFSRSTGFPSSLGGFANDTGLGGVPTCFWEW